VLTDDVADLAVGLIIGLLRKLPAAEQHVRQGKWLKGDVPLARKVSGKKFGILGLGRIGRAIADRLAPFGPVYYSDLSKKDCPYDYVADFLDLARACDVLILASAANDSNKGLISTGLFEALGPQGYVVNVARGSLVDESALIAAIENGVIAGAALDVYAAEPVVPTSLIESDKVMLTPHIASATIETRTAMADLVLANLRAYAAGEVLPTALV
jgi:lactate dehydrogenase-like 2-hydroxyacid dehydrogenase